jgi:hypothetical protein
VTVWVMRIYGSERGDTTIRESRIKREIGLEIDEGAKKLEGRLVIPADGKPEPESSTLASGE